MSVPHSASMTRMVVAPSMATKSPRVVGTVTAAPLCGSEPRFAGAERRTQKIIHLARSSFSAHRPRVGSSSTRRIRTSDMDGPTVSTAAAMASREDDDGSIHEDVRGAPEEMSSAASAFASMFAAATDEVRSSSSTTSVPSGSGRYDENGEECCDPADEECVDSPFCSITYVDESGDDDGEGIFLPPMMDPRGGGGDGGGGEGGTATATRPAPTPPAPTVPLRATIEVCMGKACARAGAQEVLDTVCAGLPNGWNAQPGRKCMGMCKRACVVRVTSDADQVVHTNVKPTTAAITVLPGRSYPAFPSFVDVEPPAGAATTTTTTTRAARDKKEKEDKSRVPAAAGLFAAAAAAVESGGALNTSPSDEESTGEEGNEEGVSSGREKKKKKKKSSSAVLRAARMASQRIGAMDIEAYNADKIDRR